MEDRELRIDRARGVRAKDECFKCGNKGHFSY